MSSIRSYDRNLNVPIPGYGRDTQSVQRSGAAEAVEQVSPDTLAPWDTARSLGLGTPAGNLTSPAEVLGALLGPELTVKNPLLSGHPAKVAANIRALVTLLEGAGQPDAAAVARKKFLEYARTAQGFNALPISIPAPAAQAT